MNQYVAILKKYPDYCLFYYAQLISFLGTMISSVALPYQIYQETHSTFMVGLLGLCQLVPLLVTSIFGGFLADTQPRLRILLFSNFLLMLCSLILLWNSCLSQPHLWILFLISPIMFSFYGIIRPAGFSIKQEFLEKKDFATVSALTQFTNGIGALLGPAVGGLVIAHAGLPAAYGLDAFSFIASFLIQLKLPIIARTNITKTQSTFLAIKESLQYAASRQDLLGAYLVDFFAMVFGMPMALFPAIAHANGGPNVLGLLYAAPAAGAVLITLNSKWVSKVQRYGMAIAITTSLWGVVIIFLGLTTSHIWAVLFFSCCAGAADSVSSVFRQTISNQTIPNHLRGRMYSLEMITCLSGPKLGDAESGIVAAAFGVDTSIISGGVLCIIAVGACCYALPRLWNGSYEDAAISA